MTYAESKDRRVGSRRGGGGGGFDIYSDSSPLEIVSSPSLPLPPIAFFCHDHVYSRNWEVFF